MTTLFWLQDRLGWRVTKWSGCGDRKCRTCPRVPMEREPRWWNWYGKRLVARYQSLICKGVNSNICVAEGCYGEACSSLEK